jgi:ribosomal protein L11 methyltransferase
VGYLALRFDAEEAELWSDALLEEGASSVDIADPAAGTERESALFDEPGIADPRWKVSRVTALFPAAADPTAALARAGARLGRVPPAHETHAVADRDWVRATQAQFNPVRITERLWIVPSWCTAPEPAAINVTLDPGLAFGTGTHPTTRLCLEWLATRLPAAATVLDYGCGSGILAIAAARLGAAHVTGVDIDPQAVEAARANAAANGVAGDFLPSDGLAPLASFDVVVANILANPLRLLAPALASRTRPGGQIVLSGVLAEQAAGVVATYAPWFIIDAWKNDEGWVALAGVRRASPGSA